MSAGVTNISIDQIKIELDMARWDLGRQKYQPGGEGGGGIHLLGN
jgi:hypothetical protein